MFRVKHNTIPETFWKIVIQHKYATIHSKNNFEEPKITFNVTKIAISSRGPGLWNNILTGF